MEPRHWGRSMWAVIFLVITMAKSDGNIELCKKRLYVICSTLPCVACRTHALDAIRDNNVLSSNDLNYIYFFFISLFNNLARDKTYTIDTSKIIAL